MLLAALFATHTLRQLERKFSRKAEDITAAHDFYIQHKRLKIKTIKRSKTTLYKPGYAEGAESVSRFVHEYSRECLNDS